MYNGFSIHTCICISYTHGPTIYWNVILLDKRWGLIPISCPQIPIATPFYDIEIKFVTALSLLESGDWHQSPMRSLLTDYNQWLVYVFLVVNGNFVLVLLCSLWGTLASMAPCFWCNMLYMTYISNMLTFQQNETDSNSPICKFTFHRRKAKWFSKQEKSHLHWYRQGSHWHASICFWWLLWVKILISCLLYIYI